MDSPPLSPSISEPFLVETHSRGGSEDSTHEEPKTTSNSNHLTVPEKQPITRLSSRGSLTGRKQPAGAVLHNTDLAKIANEEWQALLKGERYYCQLVVGNTAETRDVILNVNLSGIRLLDRKTEQVINQFDIEQILQYSYSQQNSTFSFSYLEEGRFFVTHKFISKEYLEIHQYLGNAIAIVIKLKTQIKKSGASEALNMIDNQRSTSTHSSDTLRRSSLAKSYFEQKYKSRSSAEFDRNDSRDFGGNNSPDSIPEEPFQKEPTAAGRLQSLFVPPTPLTPAKDEPKSPRSPNKYLEEQSRKYKELYASSDSGLTEEDELSIKELRRPVRMTVDDNLKRLRSEGDVQHESDDDKGHGISSSLSSSSLSAINKDSLSKKGTVGRSSRLAGSLRFGKTKDVLGSMTEWTTGFNTLRKKAASRPPTAEELEKQMKRFSVYDPGQLPETKSKTDNTGKVILIKTMISGNYQITAGTVDGLVEALADENPPDTLYIDDFLLTYRNFMSPRELFDKLSTRYHIQPTGASDDKHKKKKDKKDDKEKDKESTELDLNTAMVIRTRVLSVVKKWVDRHWFDFDGDEMREKLNKLIEEVKSEFSVAASQLLKNIEQSEKRRLESQHDEIAPLGEHEVFDFSSYNPKDVANHLCYVAVKMLQKIQPDEFVVYLWGKKYNNKTEMTKNLQRFIDRFNKVGFWVATEICKCSDIKKRTSVLERFIAVAKYCFRLQNYNDVVAILSGLNTIPIYRLKKTWAAVSQKHMTIFRDLEAKMSPENNYKIYRQLEFEAKPPYIPFFGLYMKDLTFMNDGNQTFLAGEMVNFEKNRAINGKINDIRSSQQSTYTFDINQEILRFCELIPAKEEDVLTDESYILEPSNRRRRTSITSINSEVSVSTVNSEDTGGTSAISEVFD